MPDPASYARVLAALKWHSPGFPDPDADFAGGELQAIASVFGIAVDRYDAFKEELFPDGMTERSERWEKVYRIATRTDISIAERRAKILSVIRRASGPRVDQILKMLSPVLDCETTDIDILENTRADIETGMVIANESLGFASLASGASTSISHWIPFPGVVDDTGVRVQAVFAGASGVTVDYKITSPSGTEATFTAVRNIGNVHHFRTEFLGEPAGGIWKWTATAHGGTASLDSVFVVVSNDVDSAKIYKFFAIRDYALGGAPDVPEAQRLLTRTAEAHMKPFVAESSIFKVSDPHSLLDRDPLGV